MKYYYGARIVIVGLGITGLSCVNFFLNRGIIPKVIDTHRHPHLIYKLPCVVQHFLGGLYDVWLLNATLIVVSPGVNLNHPIFIEALKLGIEIIGDIELFVREVTVPIVAITGSNGKSTVTRLLESMARCAGWCVGVGGNIGFPVLSLLDRPYTLYILEISSFQLDVTYSLRAKVAVILNISSDHIDRYPEGLGQYYLSKIKIYRHAVIRVVNISDPLLKFLFNDNCINQISFGINEDYANYCLKMRKGSYWIVVCNKYVFNCSNLKIFGVANYLNVLSALALSDSINIPRSASLLALHQFSGLPHRCQCIYKNHGIVWINDSKATNIGATKEAINHFKTSGTLHLLLGGDGKLANFSELRNFVYQNKISLYCFGKDKLELAELGSEHVSITNTLQESVAIIARRVQRKDIVLLSPACSSLDQFKSFKERGYVFSILARQLG